MSLFTSSPNVQSPVEPAIRRERMFSFTVRPQRGESIPELCRRVAGQLIETSATPVHLLGFGHVAATSVIDEAFRKLRIGGGFPMTLVEGAACDDQPIAGIQVHAFTGNVERIERNGRVVGSIFNEGGARQCIVGGLSSADKTLSRGKQTGQALENLQEILSVAGFELADTIRTWFFLENILSWYNDFNRARTEIYSGVKFKTGSLPASTGVGAKNPAGSALSLAAWAHRPIERTALAQEVASPVQCPAPAYGSSFSRALEVSSNIGRRLFISGTASIAPGGKTVWAGDIHKQIDLTMDVVEAILRSRGLTFDDLTRATAYFRNPADAGVFTEWLSANRLTQMPIISAQCDVCRDDLLFELEAEAETE